MKDDKIYASKLVADVMNKIAEGEYWDINPKAKPRKTYTKPAHEEEHDTTNDQG